MTDNFRRRCESALTHPVTLTALAVLLINDLVLKALWPHPWTTGKLSDLAWMVFAPPLLAYLLSFAVRRNEWAQRIAFGGSYVGLPLLYGAFNSFAPLHEWILGMFSLVSGGVAGSPLDPYDSAVIPVSMAIALWTWRRDPAAPGGLRSRLGVIAGSVAAFATVATSQTAPDHGIVNVWVSDVGTFAESSSTFHQSRSYSPSQTYLSRDGGNSWTTWDGLDNREGSLNQIRKEVETPRGTYLISGADIVLAIGDEYAEPVYSAKLLRISSNRWFQEREVQHLGHAVISSGPQAIAYDKKSGNIVLAMGIQGVVVGTPTGEWFPLPVGIYSPTEFSPANKTKALVSNHYFWVAVFAFPLAGIVLALLLANFRTGKTPLNWYMSFIFIFCPAAIIVVGNGIFWILAVGTLESDSESGINVVTAVSLPILIFGWPVLLVALLGIAFFAKDEETGIRWRAILTGYVSMALVVALVYMVWLLTGISLNFARVSAILLCTVIALAQGFYLNRAISRAATNSSSQS